MIIFPRSFRRPAAAATSAAALLYAVTIFGVVIGASASATGVSSPTPPNGGGGGVDSPTVTRVTLDDNVGGVDGPITPPFVRGRILVGGVVEDVNSKESVLDLGDMKIKDVKGCCSVDDSCPDGEAEGKGEKGVRYTRPVIGTMPQFTQEQSLAVLRRAVAAWEGGSGTWPTMSLASRIEAVENFLLELGSRRDEIIDALMWEIGKNRVDAESEFDRTVKFSRQAIEALRDATSGLGSGDGWDNSHGGSLRLFVRRAAIGVVLCLGPFNYPLNETYATLIPALLMGNVVMLKVPTVGGLAHILTMEAFAKALPPGTIQLISGSGRATMPPVMETGQVDCLAFIGGSRAADDLLRKHPEPHRLKVFFQLEAKNMGIFFPNLFDEGREEELRRAVKEAVAGSLSFNGQRCTALKLLFVPREHADKFAAMMKERVEELSVGLPWESVVDGASGKTKYSQITPLPNQGRVDYMRSLIDDAVEKGATVVNEKGGSTVGGGEGEAGSSESTLMIPAVLYPVTPGMRIWEEEQFGPVVPIAPYDSLDEVKKYARDGKYGQQASIFTSSADDDDAKAAASLIDGFANVFGKININAQCGRSPDAAPFSGRRSSAMGVMSVTDALREFSIPTVVSYKTDGGRTDAAVMAIEERSTFLQPVSSK